MARASLQKKLKQIQKKIEKSSKNYRNLVSDKKVHTLVIDEKEVYEQAIKQLSLLFGVPENGELITKEFKPLLDKGIPVLCQNFLTETKRVQKTTTTVTITIFPEGGNNFSATFVPNKKNTTDIYKTTIRRNIKQPAQKAFLDAVQAKIKDLNKGRGENNQLKAAYSEKGGISFFDIGHSSETAVSVQRKNIAENELIKWSTKQKSPAAQKMLQSLLSELQWSIDKKDIKNTEVLTVSLESGLENKLRGSKEEKALAEQLEKDLTTIIKTVGGWPELDGSDSYITKTKKRVLNNFTKHNFKNKNVKSNIKKQNIIQSTGAPVTASVARKASFAKGGEVVNSGGAVLKRGKQKTQNLFSIMTLINQKLPEQVRKNMGSPRLENTTGRFASSVKLTSVTTTRRGFPSFGYTYRKDPYQIFEDGAMGKSPWADSHRDPRQLIDASIREIAAEMAIGRFYTRRE